MATAFQPNAFQNNAFQINVGPVVNTTNDFIDYIFQFPDAGTFLRDPAIATAAPNAFGVALLVYNPVENLQLPRPGTGNVLVSVPQLSVSSVALPGFWVMLTIKGQLLTALSAHPNVQIVNDRTLMFKGLGSVISSKIDITHVNILINNFGVYVRDGLLFVSSPLLLEDGVSPLLLEDGATPLVLEGSA